MKVSIVGVTGYSGLELLRYLRQHPYVEIVSIHSHSMNKKSFESSYPHLKQLISLPLEEMDPEKIMQQSDLVFLATPSGISKELALPFIQANFPVIDLSGDFRLKEIGAYEAWYGSAAAPIEIIQKFDYGLAEYREKPQSNWIANPGCYATAAELSLAPLLVERKLELDSIVMDAKSGISGAGKGLSRMTHYSESHDNMALYKMNSHQHIPEIIQQLKKWEPTLNAIQFSTSLIPVTRGIFLTAYAKLKEAMTDEELVQLYDNHFKHNPFIRIQEVGHYPVIKQVIGSNFCDIGLAYNPQMNMITIVTVIDNLGKGAAGQAIQNLNIFASFDERCGLELLPIYP
ncbi:N-acetyl-gamma-glutamyl-phosphate reductase [Enterococcus caccae]|uniref:N-acetyl-gamma-glutamyl-phosphate reductase n=1 Tax=Enterococcus caccae ATCC BAA-1240 TaxID=1158612 RepID=R3WDJ6_9ENTE|nr:N-acetyl-gamma-glutamyl-phosphate reductase [Enterococcus caccae]EOL45941.1 N-acetyl-gamma-glutamyl-phosphate reductase [Enterococcus caccae ATCC BAA-1240]EOT61137.1 N-acetyl-gamma-glutamyl-phosphate reductase [Enterococcus caccae ATCC BAA-1240]OJG27832.1 N-acetyl-gamma-glutamyl-phosphate reductase [Enterococcus caccae]